MEEQIHAARYAWNANVVRFQIVQDKLVGASGEMFSAVYMQDIRTVTDYALNLGLQVVLNAQTETTAGFIRNESLPTQATRSFWQHIMTSYKNNPQVIFDLFNEPRKCAWRQWYRAMQGLLNYVRHAGARDTQSGWRAAGGEALWLAFLSCMALGSFTAFPPPGQPVARPGTSRQENLGIGRSDIWLVAGSRW